MLYTGFNRDCRKTLKHTISCLSHICNLPNFNDTKMAEMLLFDFSDSLIRSHKSGGFVRKNDRLVFAFQVLTHLGVHTFSEAKTTKSNH